MSEDIRSSMSCFSGVVRPASVPLIFCTWTARTLRSLPLIERKRTLRGIIPNGSPFLLDVDHIEGEG